MTGHRFTLAATLLALAACAAPVELPGGDVVEGTPPGKADTADAAWTLQFVPPNDGRPAYVFPEDLEDGMTWQTTFTVLIADHTSRLLVVEAQFLAFDVADSSELTTITVDDPIGLDLSFDWGFQYRDVDDAHVRYQDSPIHGYVSVEVQDGMVERCAHVGESDLLAAISGTVCGSHPSQSSRELSPDDRRYFVAPHVTSSGFSESLEGTYDVTIHIGCGGGACSSSGALDEGLEMEPGFCEQPVTVPGRCGDA